MNPVDPHHFLRMSLRGNAAFSVMSGLVFALGSAAVAEFLGGLPAALVLATGVQLLVFAAALLWLASQERVSLPIAMGVIAADALWVLGTVAALIAEVFSREGAMAAIGVAIVVLLFAILQSIGVLRARSSLAHASSQAGRPGSPNVA